MHQASSAVGLESALSALKSKLRMLAVVTLVAGGIAGLVLLFVPNYYTAVSTIVLPTSKGSFTNALIGQLGPIAALSGDLGSRDSTDKYISLLKSNSISDALITEHNLKNVYKKITIQELRDQLADHTRFQVLKGGLISIFVTDGDPERASKLANGYVEQLYNLNSRLAVDEAAQRREFYQRQVEEAKQQLSADEQRLKESQESTGLIQPDAQAKGVIEMIAGVRAEIARNEIEIRTMETSATDANPDLVRLRAQQAGLRAELKKLAEPDTVTGLVGTRNLPSAGLEYARRIRDVKVDETIVAALVREFEEARIDEARSAPLVQMVDRAQSPDKKAGPNRVAIILASMLSALICSVAYVLGGSRIKMAAATSKILLRVDSI
ncbi:MAG TPA: GNVR domain-containing protein [Terriglobales bacterium]|nr:GNVR domain-containing protein [Terriglobales bacterium]